MNILVLTPIASPFQHQFYERLSHKFDDCMVYPVFYRSSEHRSTWGNLVWEGVQLEGAVVKRLRFLKDYFFDIRPKVVFLGQYNCIESWYLKKLSMQSGALTLSIFNEPLIPSTLIKKYLKLALCKKFFESQDAIGVMGRRARREYGSIFKGKLLDTPYVFENHVSLREEKKDLVFLFSGGLNHRRDPLIVIDAFKIINDAFPNRVRLVFSGAGDLKDKICQKISEYRLEEKVDWLTGFKNWYEIGELYKSGDVLISAGRYNTWNLTIQEAMYAQLGIIATNTTEAADSLIIDGYNGFIIRHRLDELVEAMKRYVELPSLVDLHGQRNSEVVEVVDIERIASNVSDFMRGSF